MSFGLTMPSLSRAADSMEIGSLAIRRMSICRDAFALRIEAISAAIRPYSIVELFSSVLDRTSTVEHIPSAAISIIAKKIHDGIRRNQARAAGYNSRERSRIGSVGIACVANRCVVCRVLSQ